MLTFAFTDIEGSTRLLEVLRNGYADVLGEHADLVRSTATRWHGSEVDTQGDSFFLVFDRAADAVEFAAELQRRLADHPWPDGVAVRVRIGLHTGEAQIGRTGYVGIDVHRAARIAAAAHGGQTVLSDATRAALLADAEGLALRDLGPHRLKDLPEPERIYQLEIDGRAEAFPPLRSLDAPDAPPAPGEPPFQGLEAFDVDDADRFFGREALTAELLEHLAARDFLAIIGASGSGKSSLARAGLVASIRRDPGRLGEGPWSTKVITPTDRPMAVLEAGLGEIARDDRPTVLVVDQLEELFTLTDDDAARTAFVERLLGWLAAHSGQAKVVLTLRADFYDRLADHPQLRDAVAADQRYIGPMTRDELRTAIEEPARLGDWTFVPGLVELFLHDVGDEPGALPLLSHALLETWNRRRGRTMTLKGYGEAGGVTGAIARTADRVVLDELDPAEQAVARGVFLRLAEPGDEGRDTRRRAHLTELVPVGAERADVDRVVSALVAARLVTLGDDWAEVAHEALIAEWPALREWLDEDREGRRLHRRLTEAAREWTVLDRDPSLLARGTRLARLSDWASGHEAEMNADEVAYLEASMTVEQAEAEEREAQRERELEAARALAETERRAAVRLRRRAAILAVALVVAVGAMGAAVWQATEAQRQAEAAREQEAAAVAAQAEAEQQQSEAETQRQLAEDSAAEARSNELAASALNALETDPSLAKLLALQAAQQVREPSPETVGVLHQALAADPIIARFDGWEDGTFGQVAFPADLPPSGTELLIGGMALVEVIDWAKDEIVWSTEPGEGASFSPARFTPSGNRVVVGAFSVPRDGKSEPGDLGLFVFEAPAGGTLRHFPVGGPCGVSTWAISERSALVFTFQEDLGCIAGGGPVGLALVDLETGELTQLTEDGRGLSDGEFGALSADGRYVAYDDLAQGGQRTIVLDTSAGERLLDIDTTLAEGQEDAYVRDVSDDGRYLLLGTGPVQTIDVATGEVVARIGGEGGFTNHAQFTPMDLGATRFVAYPVMTNGRDGRVQLWDGRWGRELMTIPGVGSGTLATTEQGLVLVRARDTQYPDDSVPDVALLDLGVRGELGGLDARASGDYWEGPTFGSCFAVAGSLRASGESLVFSDLCNGPSGEATTQVVRATDLALRHSLPGTMSQVLAMSPDGTRFVRGTGDGFEVGGLEIIDTRTGERLLELEGPCAVGETDCAAYPDQPFAATSSDLAWSPDGLRIVAVDWSGYFAVWDAATGELISDEGSARDVRDVAFTEDAGRMIVASPGETHAVLESVSTETWVADARVPQRFSDDLTLVGFTTDGRRLIGISGATSQQAGTATLRWFDADSLVEVGSRSNIHSGSVKAIALSPSRGLLATGASDGTVRVWDAATGEPVHEIRTGDAEAQGLAFLDDERLAVVVRDGSLRVYTLDPEELIDLVRQSLTRSLTAVECDRYGIDPCPSLEGLQGD